MVKIAKQIKFNTEHFKINYGLSTNTDKSSFINICGWCSLIDNEIQSKDLDKEFKILEKFIKKELQDNLNNIEVNNNIFNKTNFISDIEIKKTSIKERKFGFSTIEIVLNNIGTYNHLGDNEYKTAIELIIDNIIDNCLLYPDNEKNKLFEYSIVKPKLR